MAHRFISHFSIYLSRSALLCVSPRALRLYLFTAKSAKHAKRRKGIKKCGDEEAGKWLLAVMPAPCGGRPLHDRKQAYWSLFVSWRGYDTRGAER